MASWHTKKWTKGRLRNMRDHHDWLVDREAAHLKQLGKDAKPSSAALIEQSKQALSRLRTNALRIGSIVNTRLVRRAPRHA